MASVAALWWLTFFTAVGLCLGSFLNVVIYRLPLGLDIGRPRWSFCPTCRSRIAWYDNLPVLSYLHLGGRCRSCRAPISPRYPLIELLTAAVTVSLFDAFFITQTRPGLYSASFLHLRVAEDWPVFLAHVVLFAALMAMSAIDLQHYWVDIRFTHWAAAFGVLMHVCWTPSHSEAWFRPLDATAVTCLGAMACFGLVWLFLPRHDALDPDPDPAIEPDSAIDDEGGHKNAEPEAEAEAEGTTTAEATAAENGRAEASGNLDGGGSTGGESRTGYTWIALPAAALFAVYWAVTMRSATAVAPDDGEGANLGSFAWRVGLLAATVFALILWEAAVPRDSDQEVADAIEEESSGIRRQTLLELATLLPAIAGGGLMLWLIRSDAGAGRWLLEGLHWRPMSGDWQPIYGLATAVTGYVLAAAIGWSVRIVANLVYGREAFATGDIHMMAAAGAVVGWHVVAMGFIVTCLVALAGWLVLLPLKRGRVIPLGPWLTAGFWLTTLFYAPIVKLPVIQKVAELFGMWIFNNSQPL